MLKWIKKCYFFLSYYIIILGCTEIKNTILQHIPGIRLSFLKTVKSSWNEIHMTKIFEIIFVFWKTILIIFLPTFPDKKKTVFKELLNIYDSVNDFSFYTEFIGFFYMVSIQPTKYISILTFRKWRLSDLIVIVK